MTQLPTSADAALDRLSQVLTTATGATASEVRAEPFNLRTNTCLECGRSTAVATLLIGTTARRSVVCG